MINIFCVLVKPGYNIDWVERLYRQCHQYLSHEFTFTCLTDLDQESFYPIKFVNIDHYELDTWWNKLLIFYEDYSHEGINLYFDLDITINKNINCLIDDIEEGKLTVVDTPWKDDWYFSQKDSDGYQMKRYLEYGNSSVMGWYSRTQKHLTDIFFSDIFKHTAEHYGDDTFINRQADKKYFKTIIGPVEDSHIELNVKILNNKTQV